MNRFCRSLTLLACVSVLPACAAKVAPWERGNLAKPEMALEPNPEQAAFRQHSHFSREAAFGGYGLGGGGCGCN